MHYKVVNGESAQNTPDLTHVQVDNVVIVNGRPVTLYKICSQGVDSSEVSFDSAADTNLVDNASATSGKDISQMKLF